MAYTKTGLVNIVSKWMILCAWKHTHHFHWWNLSFVSSIFGVCVCDVYTHFFIYFFSSCCIFGDYLFIWQLHQSVNYSVLNESLAFQCGISLRKLHAVKRSEIYKILFTAPPVAKKTHRNHRLSKAHEFPLIFGVRSELILLKFKFCSFVMMCNSIN